ncbi:hypothetical protein [Cellulomonas sp. URHB0016]
MDLNDFQTFLWWAVGAVAVLAAAGLTLSWLLHRRVLRRGALPEDEAASLRERLVGEVKEASKEPGTHVNTRRFWKGSRYNAAHRFVVVDPLIKDGTLTAPLSSDGLERFLQAVQREFFHRAPMTLVLNSRDWTRMAHGTPAGVVVHGPVGVVQTGPGHVHVEEMTLSVESDLDPDFLLALVAAIRVDASGMTPADAEHALSRADSIENDVAKSRFESARATAKEVLGLAATAAGLWATVVALLAP